MYSKKTVPELKKLCKERGIKGYSTLVKAKLIEKLDSSSSTSSQPSNILNDIQLLCEDMIKKYNLDGWTFKWDNTNRRCGRCTYSTKIISVSRNFAKVNDFATMKDVVLHEIAHALSPGDGHGSNWKKTCVKVGAKPMRCCDSTTVTQPKGKYTLSCNSCDFEHQMYTKTIVKRLCPKCVDEKCVLKIIKN